MRARCSGYWRVSGSCTGRGVASGSRECAVRMVRVVLKSLRTVNQARNHQGWVGSADPTCDYGARVKSSWETHTHGGLPHARPRSTKWAPSAPAMARSPGPRSCGARAVRAPGALRARAPSRSSIPPHPRLVGVFYMLLPPWQRRESTLVSLPHAGTMVVPST